MYGVSGTILQTFHYRLHKAHMGLLGCRDRTLCNLILQAASDLYAEAIELDPEEPSYYTNRAAASSKLEVLGLPEEESRPYDC